MNRIVVAAIVVFTLTGFAFLWFMFFLGIPLWMGSQKTGLAISEFIQWQTADFREPFSQGIAKAVSPLFSFRVAPGKAFIMASSAVFATWLGFRRWSIHLKRLERFSINLIPIYVAALLCPLEIKRVFRILAEHGLTNQFAIGAGLGEATSVLFFGGWCALACSAFTIAVYIIKPRSDPKPGRDSDDSPT